MKTLRFLPLFAACVLAGCAGSDRIDYRTVPTFPATSGARSVAVVGVDSRDDLKTGEIDAIYVGLHRDAVAIPFRVYTLSNNPAVNDLAFSVAQGLKEAGVNAKSVDNPNPGSMKTALKAAAATGRSRILVVKAYVLESDTLLRTELRYSFTFQVWDRSGNMIAATHVEGEPILTAQSSTAFAAAQAAVPSKIRSLMRTGIKPLLKDL